MNNRLTRSSKQLTGNIHDYLFQKSNKSKTMADGNGDNTGGGNGDNNGGGNGDNNGGGSGDNGGRTGVTPPVSLDIQQVLAEALQNMTSSNQLLQQQYNSLLNRQNPAPATQSVHQKIENCPIKRKYCNLEAWISEVTLWNESNITTEAGYGKKYLKLIESIHNSEECDDLKHLVQVEFVENEGFNKKDKNTISVMLDIIKQKLGKTDIEKSTEAWMQFIDIKQAPEENTKDFVARFEQTETKLRNVQINIPKKALAIQLLNRSSLSTMSKENVLTKVNTDDQNTIYENMMKGMKELKSNLTSTGNENQTYYGNSRYNRSTSQKRERSNRFRSNSRDRNRFQRSSSRDRNQRSYSRDKSKFERSGSGEYGNTRQNSDQGRWNNSGDRRRDRHNSRRTFYSEGNGNSSPPTSPSSDSSDKDRA